MRKSSLVLMAIFCLLWAGLWFRPTPSLAVAKAQSGQISKNQTTTLQPHQYWLMPDLQPERAHLDQQFTVWLDALVPELMTAQRDGRLQAFTPVPELYAILLTQADAALLPQLAMRVGGQNMVVDTPVVVQQRIDALQTWHELSQSFQPDEAVPALADELRPSALLTSTLNSFTAYLDEAYVYGYLDTPNTLITLTLKTGAVVKSQVNTLSNGGNYFDAYFTAVIAGGDTIEVEMPGSATAVVTVAPLTLMSDKAADTLYGTAPANSSVYTWVFSEFEWQWYQQPATTNGSGAFVSDFSSQIDIFIGDDLQMSYTDGNNYRTYLRNLTTMGTRVSPDYETVYGYAEPGSQVDITLKDSGGTVKAMLTDDADNNGYFWVNFATANIEPGDMVEVDSDGGYNQTVEVVDVYLTNIAPDMDSLTGMAPANSKVELYVYDDFIGDNAGLVATATAAGMFTADFSGIYDILPGGYGSPIYHDAQDNEVANAGLYAGPYVKAYFNSYTDLNVVGDPHQPIEATLRNALGAIKATASATTGVNGYSSFSFYDSIGNHVDVLPNDVVDVVYGDSALQAGGVFTRTVTAVDIDFVIDRNNKTVYGTGPANSMLRLVYDWGTQTADVPTDGNGDFTYTFGGVLNGNYNFDITYRNGAGDDLYTWGRVPQFTAVYENNNIYGYGVGDNIVVATLKDYNGNIKSTANTTTSRDGWYWLYLDGPISLTDIIEVDTGPLHFSQDIVALTLDADTTNNIVYGTAPPNAWLNVFDENSFGPYALYNYKYFSADGLGNYTAAFAEVYGGDSLQVIYWEGGHYDRVSMGRNTPGLFINHVTDNVYLYAGTLDAVGTITIRDSSNAIKASATITAQNTSANVNYWPDVNIVPGDSVEVNIGELVQTSDVIPLSGSLNLNTDTVSGTSLPNKPIGVEAYHWNGTSYSQYVGAGTLSQFASSNGSGAFSANFSGYVDLTAGDYMGLFFIDEMDTHYQAHFYTTNPTIATTEYPTAVQPYASVPIETTISNGQHVQTVYVYWDTVSHAADNDYASLHAGASGAIGPNIVVLYAPAGGTIYFKTAARVDGQLVWESTEHTITVDGTTATTIYAPVSGTTNDTTPEIRAVAPPNAFVTLYDGNDVAVMTKTADANGRVTFNLTTPLNPGSYEFYAVAAVSGTAGPASNTLHLAVDPTLPVDPVNILVTANGRKQHLRDANGYANLGGRVWTRTGDSVAISIPISATGVISAELYVGGVFDSALINSGNDVYLGSYTPPTTGAYSLDLKLYTGTTQTINILTGLIDPDGYVYDASLGADYRLAGAVVTCYEWVEGEWLVWNGAIWGQSNAQTTAADGYYAFFTLPGDYKVVVSADGYGEYESPVLTVVDAPVHHNVALWPIHELYLPFVVKP